MSSIGMMSAAQSIQSMLIKEKSLFISFRDQSLFLEEFKRR